MQFFKDVWHGLIENFTASLGWLSVQVTAGWAVVWIIFSQLPANVIAELANTSIWHLSVVAWMGVIQTLMTYFARLKRPKADN